MSKGILTVTVNPAVDVTVSLTFSVLRSIPTLAYARSGPRLSPPKADERRGQLCVLSAGGKGINVARVLRKLRAPVLAVGLAGGGTGELLQKFLHKEKISAAFVRTREPTRLNVTVLGPRPGNCSRVIEEGPRLTPQEIRRFEIRYRQWLRRSYFVVLSGRNAVGAPVDWYARLVRLARQEDVPAAVDTSGATLAAALKAKPFLIKPNLEEAEAIVHCRLKSPVEIKKAIRQFHARGIRVVLLSLGSRGAVVSDGRNIFCARPPRVGAVNDVGCGDALLAGFIQAHCVRKFLSEALRQAVACGTANALNSTPGLIRLNDVLRLTKIVTVSNWRPLGQ